MPSEAAIIPASSCGHDDTAESAFSSINVAIPPIANASIQTMLNCVDNSGATLVECIANLRMKRHAKVGMSSSIPLPNTLVLMIFPGDRIIVVVQRARNLGESNPGAGGVTTNKVRRGDIRHAVVVRTVKKQQRKDGMVVRFDDNACALIGKGGEPIGTRINGRLHYSRSEFTR